MYNRLYDYLIKEKILYEKQFGFQKNHSTDYPVATLADEILKGFDSNLYTLGVFIDLSKDFDTVNHEILLDKMSLHGIKGVNLNWFRSYLVKRKQGVSYEKKCSPPSSTHCGVPQVSILGPLLFFFCFMLTTCISLLRT